MRSPYLANRTKDVSGSQNGFSLVELIVAMAVFAIVSAAVFGLLQVGRIERNRSSQRSDVLKNARIAVHMIGRDALNAGLGFHRAGAVTPDNFVSTRLGLPADVDTERDLLTSIVAGDNINPNDLLANPAARTDSVAFCYRDMDFNAGQLIMLQNVSNDPGTPAVPFVNTLANAAQNAQIHHLYLIESDTTQVAIMATNVSGNNRIEAAPGDPLGLNQALNGVGTNGSVLRQCIDQNDENCTTYVATAKRFNLVNYRIRQDGTLVRIVFGNNVGAAATAQIQEQPLAYNVEDLQIDYVLQNGTVTSRPNAGPDGIVGNADDFTDGFNQIRQITVRITVQSTERDERTGLPERLTLNATFSARNMEYDAG
jgi:prepilin-type N-terminal cleavage/methylation domain-containing protein